MDQRGVSLVLGMNGDNEYMTPMQAKEDPCSFDIDHFLDCSIEGNAEDSEEKSRLNKGRAFIPRRIALDHSNVDSKAVHNYSQHYNRLNIEESNNNHSQLLAATESFEDYSQEDVRPAFNLYANNEAELHAREPFDEIDDECQDCCPFDELEDERLAGSERVVVSMGQEICSAKYGEDELDEELKDLMQRVGAREKQIRHEIASFRIQSAYRHFILKKRLAETYSHQLSYNSFTPMTRSSEPKEDKSVVKKYLDHCASLIQHHYKKYKSRRDRSSHNPSLISNAITLPHEKVYCEDCSKACKHTDERPIKSLGRTSYDIEGAMAIELLAQRELSSRAAKKSFLRRKAQELGGGVGKGKGSGIARVRNGVSKLSVNGKVMDSNFSKTLSSSKASSRVYLGGMEKLNKEKRNTTAKGSRAKIEFPNQYSKSKAKPNNVKNVNVKKSKAPKLTERKSLQTKVKPTNDVMRKSTTIKKLDARKATQKIQPTQRPELKDKASSELIKAYNEYHKDHQSMIRV
eukprot:TRINITY_DN9306_c0_g1_i13.p1 TRINITY_DN9306_c0_g1~~TRINITY_DN9306_c0_g1_i13.p1  ORF type:complete len:517 (-),score=91.82 TRINITY_DN9306_c0_g1_i13:328-1878(-)